LAVLDVRGERAKKMTAVNEEKHRRVIEQLYSEGASVRK
jgi:hypothetical protein